MGSTTRYGLRWPENFAKVKDGAAAIRTLAEDVEAALRAPLLVTDGSGVTSWSSKVAEIGWDVSDDPDRKRGTWGSTGVADQLVLPPVTGFYLVDCSVRFGGKSEADWYDLQIRTRQVGDTNGTGTIWSRTRIQQPSSTDGFTQLGLSSIVRVPDTSPRTGIAVRIEFGGTSTPPDIGSGINKIRVHRLSSL